MVWMELLGQVEALLLLPSLPALDAAELGDIHHLLLAQALEDGHPDEPSPRVGGSRWGSRAPSAPQLLSRIHEHASGDVSASGATPCAEAPDAAAPSAPPDSLSAERNEHDTPVAGPSTPCAGAASLDDLQSSPSRRPLGTHSHSSGAATGSEAAPHPAPPARLSSSPFTSVPAPVSGTADQRLPSPRPDRSHGASSGPQCYPSDSLYAQASSRPTPLNATSITRFHTGPGASLNGSMQQSQSFLESTATRVLSAQIRAVSTRRAPLDTLAPGSKVQALDEGACVWCDAVVRGLSPAETCLEVVLDGGVQTMRVPAEGIRGRPRRIDPCASVRVVMDSERGKESREQMPKWMVVRPADSQRARMLKIQRAAEWEAHNGKPLLCPSRSRTDLYPTPERADSLHPLGGPSMRSQDTGSSWVDPSTFWASVQQTGQQLQHERDGLPSHEPDSAAQRATAWARELLLRARAQLIVTGRVLLHDPSSGIWPAVVLIVLMGLGLWGVYSVAYSTAAQKRDESLAAAQGVAQDLIMRIGATLAPITTMATFITLAPNFTLVNETFYKVAPLLLPGTAHAVDSATTMELAPNGIVQLVYPTHLQPGYGFNPSFVYGLDVLQNASWRPDALRTIQLHQEGLVLSGPVSLVAGPTALLARYAVFIDGAGANDTFGAPGSPFNCSLCYEPPSPTGPNGTWTLGSKFWGIVALTVGWEALTRNASSLYGLCDADGLSMRMTYKDPTTAVNRTIASCGGDASYDSLLASGSKYAVPLFLDVNVMQNHWVLAVWTEGGWLPDWLPYVVALVVLLSFLVSLLLLVVMVNRREHMWLLQAMLPKKVIKTLQRGEPYVEAFSNVTVLFSDVVSYTTLASKLQPIEIVRILNEMYSAYDALVDEFGCYKVETIGDAFMAVCGTQGENAKDAAARAAGLALAMIERTRSLRLQLEPGPEGRSLQGLQIRVGLHSGPVVGAVLGNKMPHLCLCGDTVNTASRMETNSAPMRVHVSGSTAELLELGNAQGIRVEPRGQIDVKGKGLMNTFWLAPQNVASRDPSRRVGAATAGVSTVDSSVRLRKSAPSARDAVGEVGLKLGSREEHAGSLYDCGSGGGNGVPSTVSAEKDRFSGSTLVGGGGGGGGGGGSTSSDTTNSNGSFRTLTTLGAGSASHGRSRLMVDLRIFQAGGSSRGGTNSGATDASSAGQLSTSGAAQAGRRPSHEVPRVPAVAQVRLSAPNS